MIDKVLVFLKENGYVNSQNEKMLRYGLRKVEGIILDFSVTALLGCVLGIIIESILFWMAVFFLRIYVGGYHASEERTCTVISFASTALSLLYLFSEWENPLFFCIAIVLGVISFICAPVEAVNKPLSKKEREVFGRYARTITAVCIGVSFLGYCMEWSVVYRSVTAAVVVTGIGVIVGKLIRVGESRGI